MSNTETHLTDGLLTDEILARAMSELQEVQRGLTGSGGDDAWLRECEGRLDNAVRDVGVVLARFRKAQT